MLQVELAKTTRVSGAMTATQTLATCSDDVDGVIEPPAKKPKLSSLFSRYSQSTSQSGVNKEPERQLQSYLELINSETFDCTADSSSLSSILKQAQFAALSPLFSRLFCVPASSAPVERVFSQSGLIMRPNRSKMSDAVLENLVFLKCNLDL